MFDSKDVEVRRLFVMKVFFFVTTVLFIQKNKKKTSHFIWTTVIMRFYKSTHCSLMLTTGLGVNADCQSLGTCQQLLCVSVQRTFRYFFKLCGISFVVGFWHIWETVCMYVCVWACVEVKMYIWMKLNQTFTPSFVRLSHFNTTLLKIWPPLPQNKISINSCSLFLFPTRASCLFRDIFVAP